MNQSFKLLIFSISILFTSAVCADQTIKDKILGVITEITTLAGSETATSRMHHQFTEQAPCNGAKGYYHPNGGGFVADTAMVAETVVLEEGVEVCDKATIKDDVTVSGYTIVDGSSHISGQAQIDHAHVTDNAEISGQVTVSMVGVGCNVKISGDTTEIYGTQAWIPCDRIITSGTWSFE